MVDISDIDYKNKEKITIETLKMANVSEAKINKMITVYNKIDLSPYNFCSERNILISAYTGDGINELKAKLMNY